MCEQDYSPSAELISLILNWLEVQLIRNRTLISLVIVEESSHGNRTRSPALVNQWI